MSRNGNYLRKNSKPVFAVFADEQIQFGEEKDESRESRAILQFPQGSSAQYITWAQAVENLKFYVTELRQSFFTQLQLPDWSYESMKSTPMSGESRKQLFIDSQLKVKDESGRLLEFFDREVNVVKALGFTLRLSRSAERTSWLCPRLIKTFLKTMLPQGYAADIDALPVETVITPFTLTDDKDTVENLMAANGGLPIISQRESIEAYGRSANIDKTQEEIARQGQADIFEPTE